MVWTEASDDHLSTHVVDGYPKVTREGNCVVQEYIFHQIIRSVAAQLCIGVMSC